MGCSVLDKNTSLLIERIKTLEYMFNRIKKEAFIYRVQGKKHLFKLCIEMKLIKLKNFETMNILEVQQGLVSKY